MSDEARARELFTQLHPFDLPVGVYLVAEGGRFLECSRRVREILGLPLEGPLPPDASIADYYQDPPREEILRRLSEAEKQGRCLESCLIRFRVDGRDVFVRLSCHYLRDPENRQVVGYVGCMAEVTEEEGLRQLFHHLTIGLYRLDAEGTVIYANDAFAQIFGYKSRREVEGRHASEFYAYPEEAQEFTELVKKRKTASREVRELVKRDGELFYGSISTAGIFGPRGDYQGREGTLVDVTEEERYRRSLDEVPVGYYRVRIVKGIHRIRQCNAQFAKMFSFDSKEAVLGTNIRDLYAEESDYEAFMRAIQEADARGEPLLGHPLKVKSRTGRRFTIEINSRLLKDRDGSITGRTGVVRDITKEEALREEMESLRRDVGSLLHAYSATLLTVWHALPPVIMALGPDPFEPGTLLAEAIEGALREPKARLVEALDQLLSAAESGWLARALLQDAWRELSFRTTQLAEEVDGIEWPELRPPLLRRIAREMINLCNNIPKEGLSTELIGEVVESAAHLERMTCLVALRHAEENVVTMDYQVRSFRERVVIGATSPEPTEIFPLRELIDEAIHNLDEFAGYMRVDLKPRDGSRGAKLKGIRREIVRALSNLLHNAIKYSWSRGTGARPWVDIHAYVQGAYVRVAFENWGVPVPPDEIEDGSVFQMGYRGRLSGDKGRLGTGVGLTDAREVARRYDGDVTIKSTPTQPDASPDDLKVAYLTTVTLSLPVHEESER